MSAMSELAHDMPAGVVETWQQPQHIGGTYLRVRHVCPLCSRETVSAPATSRTGRALLAGDVSEEWCGFTSCPWEGERVTVAPVIRARVTR